MQLFSEQITKSLKIMYLLKGDIKNSMNFLSENHESSTTYMAYRLLFIDLCSFLDEIKVFDGLLWKEEADDYKIINKFLLLSHNVKKALNKSDQAITKLRNTIYAHNYRDKGKQFVDPLITIALNYKQAPILRKDLLLLGEIATLYVSLAIDCFPFNSDKAYIELKRSSEWFYKLSADVKESEDVKGPSVESFQRDVYHIRDMLKSHNENYKIISEKIRCKIRE